MDFIVRSLSAEDWRGWKEVRHEALRLHPEAFGSSYEEELQDGEDKIRQFLTDNKVFGAYTGGALVGVGGFIPARKKKMRHQGTFFGMYLKKEHRGLGIADALIEAVIGHAATQALQLHCTVMTENAAAVKLYRKHGFEIYGTEPRALKANGRFYDEYLMVRKLD